MLSQQSTAHRTICLHRHFFQQYLSCAVPTCRAMFWGFPDVVVFFPKHTYYRVVQESSVYTCTIRNQWAYSSLPVIFFCCE